MPQQYNQFLTRIKHKLGIDLTLYKETQMKRRIISLRNKRGFRDFASYYRALEKDDLLLKEFTKRLTINVSEFYRNPKRWDVLKESIIPILIDNKRKLNIWSAACSTGEEPYSVAMLFNEYFPHIKVNIIGSDIDNVVLTQAKQGCYYEQSLKNLPDRFKNNYFTYENGLYHVNRSIKQMVSFKKHNLLADPYPNNIDLILCRNVLIYFTDEAKEKIYQSFSESLNDKGVLFVGSTEQIFNAEKYHLQLIKTFFYQKK